jgi:hypothetical protein
LFYTVGAEDDGVPTDEIREDDVAQDEDVVNDGEPIDGEEEADSGPLDGEEGADGEYPSEEYDGEEQDGEDGADGEYPSEEYDGEEQDGEDNDQEEEGGMTEGELYAMLLEAHSEVARLEAELNHNDGKIAELEAQVDACFDAAFQHPGK